MAKAGLKAIYLSGWQVAAETNTAGATYPDQSLYPVNSVPALVKRINNVSQAERTGVCVFLCHAPRGRYRAGRRRNAASEAEAGACSSLAPKPTSTPACPAPPPLPLPLQALQRADQIEYAEGKVTRDYFLPIVADAEAGFGGPLNAYELTKHLIESGAAGGEASQGCPARSYRLLGCLPSRSHPRSLPLAHRQPLAALPQPPTTAVHFEDQLSSEKKCGHLGGKVLVPTQSAVRNLIAGE